jgi:hypothetical protein
VTEGLLVGFVGLTLRGEERGEYEGGRKEEKGKQDEPASSPARTQ